MSELTEKEKRIILESLKCHAEEGFCRLNDYNSGADGNDIRNLAKKLFSDIGVPLIGRDWLP
jgi:hypothetical protein